MDYLEEYQIAIPSYNRPHIIKDKTLKLLKRLNIDNKQILIFVENEKQKEKYINHGLQEYNFITTSTQGIMEKRNFLETYYREQTQHDRVLYMDDDLDDIMILDKKNPKITVPIEEKEFKTFIVQAFNMTEYLNLSIFGVSALHNPFYMSYNTTTNLKYISGAFKGCVIRRDRHEIHTDIDHFEDYQFSCEYYLRDRGVIKYNHISIKTDYFIEEGGICESMGGLQKRKDSMEPNSKYMQERYGAMVNVVEKKWGKEIKLNWRYKINETAVKSV